MSVDASFVAKTEPREFYMERYQTAQPTDTMRSGLKTNVNSVALSTTLSNKGSAFQSRVALTQKPTLGKNPPPKLPVARQKNAPSIPSNSVAPPEDKTMTQNASFNQEKLVESRDDSGKPGQPRKAA